jgi:hypothetical protein
MGNSWLADFRMHGRNSWHVPERIGNPADNPSQRHSPSGLIAAGFEERRHRGAMVPRNKIVEER